MGAEGGRAQGVLWPFELEGTFIIPARLEISLDWLQNMRHLRWLTADATIGSLRCIKGSILFLFHFSRNLGITFMRLVVPNMSALSRRRNG